ncbi:hypothetical protein Y032_0835g2600 [Ancylostoma ceylanicum]|uniref:Uncharacterized protein n=1 Tax=Ancylostoma ceylanicum TaxID=53326 RepID=A0A016WDF6_9BILA|nr:hypothetical protein Y032_0835g2600 [Ancylostoma ceylanicum]
MLSPLLGAVDRKLQNACRCRKLSMSSEERSACSLRRARELRRQRGDIEDMEDPMECSVFSPPMKMSIF